MTVKTLRWGILASGNICTEFVGDLLLDPASTRGVTDVAHEVAAVASLSGKGPSFLERVYSKANKLELIKDIKVYSDYESLVADPNVDIIYVASPQSHHYRHVKLSLNAGKHVLCEKPFTINEAQAQALIDLAKSKKLFLMEARWVKFFDLFQQVRKLITEDRILGKVYKVCSDFGEGFPDDPNFRLQKAELGGGSMLDLGVYPLTFVSALLWDTPENQREFPQVVSSFRWHPDVAVDEDTTIILQFPKARATGLVTSNQKVNLFRQGYHTIIYGEKGELTISSSHTSRPDTFTIHLKDQEPKTFVPNLPGWGMFWEADECARCIRDGKLESEIVSHEESLYTMRVFDEARKQQDYKFPADIEAVD
ncbi:unnamed protein product [Sympodiomycopsis kandeliae]